MKISKRQKPLKIFLILLVITSCQLTPVKIDEVKDFKSEYYDLPDQTTEEIIYQHTIIIAKKEILYLRKYIEILVNRINAADKERIIIIKETKD